MERHIAVIGTGDFARAFARRLIMHGYSVTCGSRSPQKRHLGLIDPVLAAVKVTSIEQCIRSSNVIILAVHQDHHESLISFSSALSGKILIDVSNPREMEDGSSIAERLAMMFPMAHVVKAFNTVSTYTLENTISGESRMVCICGDDAVAKNTVSDLVTSLGFNPRDIGTLAKAKDLEQTTLRLFPAWHTALKMTSVIFSIWFIYGNARYLFLKKDPYGYERAPSNITNKAFACTALTLLAITYLPGCLAAFLQILNGTKHERFPSWLDTWLKARKYVGILALVFALLHMVLSIALLSPAYFKPWYISDKVVVENGVVAISTRMNALGETVLVLGVLAVLLMCILGLTSVQVIGELLSWKEWTVVQSYMGYTCLVFATLHVTVIAIPDWLSEPFYMAIQRLTLLSCICPWIVLCLKAILCIPPVNNYLWNIRRGWERGNGVNKKNC